jgi:tetratricopeptide (TPR) repeat protein
MLGMRLPRLAPLVAFALVVATPAWSQDSVAARAAYDRGRVAHQQRKVDEAVKLFERAVSLDANNSDYHLWLGHAYTRQIATVNFLKKATLGRKIGAEYNRAVELAPTSIEAAEARMEFFMEAPGIAGGGMDKAKAEAARIASLSKYRGRFAAAKLAEREKDLAAVEREYRALVADYADSSSAVTALATFLQTQNRFDEAFTVVGQRLAKFPDDTTNIYQLGRIAALSGQRLAAGETALRRFLSMLGVKDAASLAHGHYRLGMIREKLGDSASAIAEYTRAVELFPPYEPAASAIKKLSRR